MDKKIRTEFSSFKNSGITKELLETTWNHCKENKEFKRFKIINGKVYGDECRIKTLLEAIVQAHTVPDVDFIYYYEDRLRPSFFTRSAFKKCAPIFVSAKHRSLKRAILFSDWVYDIADHKNGWNSLIKTVNAHKNIAWEDKIEKLFWRGTPWDGKHFGMYNFDNWTSFPRGRLVYESKLHPDLIDAAFSQYPDQCLSVSLDLCKQVLGEISFVSWADTLRYKYQIAIDGVTCSFPATQWKLLSGSVTFKQTSPDIMYFYDELIAWKHFIPVKQDLSDLIQKIRWAKTHDAQAKEIGQNGRNFALTHLMPEHILEYCYKTLLAYAALQKFQPTLDM